MPIVVDGKTFETDEEGYLANINDWVPGVAGVMAKDDLFFLPDILNDTFEQLETF